MFHKLKQTLIYINILISFSVGAESSFKVMLYFDGEVLHNKGPYKISFNSDEITSIERVSDKQLDANFLMPPLIDAHVHSFVFKDPRHADISKELKYNSQLSSRELKRGTESFLRDMRNSGFLFLRDLGGPNRGEEVLTQLILSYESLPFVLLAKSSLTWGLGQCTDAFQCSDHFTNIENWGSLKIKRFLRNYKLQNGLIKIYLDSDPLEGEMPLKVASLITQYSRTLDLKVAIHMRKDVKYLKGIDGPHISLEHFNKMAPLIPRDELKATLVPTLYPQVFKEQILKAQGDHLAYSYDYKDEFNSLKKNLKGSSFCFGSDFYYLSHDPVRGRGYYAIESLREYSKLGKSNLELLRSITSHCHPLFKGERNRPGHIKVGDPPHFLLLEGNPIQNLKDLHNIKALYKQGRKIKK